MQLELDNSLPFSEVVLHRRRVKRLSLRVRENGAVEMVGPRRISNSEFEQFYRSKQQWVSKQRQHFLAAHSNKPQLAPTEAMLHGEIQCSTALGEVSDEKVDAYRAYAKNYLGKRLTTLSDQTGLSFSRLTIRAQRTRWGSCSSKGNISLNWRLVQMPVFVSDYVMIHELCHTVHMNHSAAFWQLVRQHFPETENARRWLKANGSQLPD